MTASTTAHHRTRRRARGTSSGAGSTIVSISTSSITLWAAALAGLSVLFLVALDRRQPPNRRPLTKGRVNVGRRPARTLEVVHLPTARYKPTPLWRRALSALELGGLTLALGAVLAVGIAAALVAVFFVADTILR